MIIYYYYYYAIMLLIISCHVFILSSAITVIKVSPALLSLQRMGPPHIIYCIIHRIVYW